MFYVQLLTLDNRKSRIVDWCIRYLCKMEGCLFRSMQYFCSLTDWFRIILSGFNARITWCRSELLRFMQQKSEVMAFDHDLVTVCYDFYGSDEIKVAASTLSKYQQILPTYKGADKGKKSVSDVLKLILDPCSTAANVCCCGFVSASTRWRQSCWCVSPAARDFYVACRGTSGCFIEIWTWRYERRSELAEKSETGISESGLYQYDESWSGCIA